MSLADVHAVFAYYFRHRTAMEAYLAERERSLGSRPGSWRTIPPRASGPRCLPALTRGPTVQQQTMRVDDLARDPRWPVLGPRAAERGVHSTLCLQLFVVRDTLGALDLLGRAPSAFTDESEHVGLLLASHAAIAAADAHHFENVNSALVNRDVIGQAKGILMERFKITSDQAFAALAKVSQDTNRKVSAVAEDLARTGMWIPGARQSR
ncbi:MAG: hypothetical protein JWO67_6284 [Streptosporangiaceae bacterium]|nr:hypothetical protein [Streptosporangiaceae bacterium]